MLKNGIIYQAYLPSFVKKIPDITGKIQYLKSLNVNYLWLNPIYENGGKDCGYDIVDYLKINPKYGNIQDLTQLITSLNNEKIKILMDLVINHTSNKHIWFQKSIDKIEPYTDYYIWRDKKDVNFNLKSEFENTAWTYNHKRKQYYYHYFYKEQPDLNLKNKLVIDEIKKIIKFWFEKGIGGFRMDAISCLIPNEKSGKQLNTARTFKLLNELRYWIKTKLSNNFLLLGETEFDNISVAKQFYKSIDLVMNYRLAYINKLDPLIFRNELKKWYKLTNNISKTPLFYFYNHDRKRQRYGENNYYIAKLMSAILLIQSGIKIIYYGQEINMREGKNNYIDEHGRDGCRTPMQWNDSYINSPDWIKINDEYKFNNVCIQNKDPDSILNWYRFLTKFQKNIQKINDILLDNNLLVIYLKKKTKNYKIIFNFENSYKKYLLNNIIKRSYIHSEKNIINPFEVIIIHIN
tara:strand:+ start:1028 stop:2416 length:1389 start_codon:yes stop_codon:yes gene_type:complete